MFAENLKKLMAERGMSAAELSRLTGYSRSAVSQYLSGTITRPSSGAVEAIAAALQCGIEELYGVAPPEPGRVQELADRIPVLTPQDVAKLLHKSVRHVYESLEQGTVGFGHATLMPSGKWSYCIYPLKFMEITGIPVIDADSLCRRTGKGTDTDGARGKENE